MLTVLHIFRNKEKPLLNLEYFADNKPSKKLFVQFGKKNYWATIFSTCMSKRNNVRSLEP